MRSVPPGFHSRGKKSPGIQTSSHGYFLPVSFLPYFAYNLNLSKLQVDLRRPRMYMFIILRMYGLYNVV